jgi:hypothetical protein
MPPLSFIPSILTVTEDRAGLGAKRRSSLLACSNVLPAISECSSLFSITEFPDIPLPHSTVTVREQVELCPFGATARQVLVVTPTGKIEPLARPMNKNGVSVPEQLSEAVGLA